MRTTTTTQSTLVGPEQTLYDALRERKLLIEPNDFSGLGHLVRQGEIGMSSNNGQAVFYAPGRHILWSPLNTWKGVVPISSPRITLNNITIVTIDNSELGLAKRNGMDFLLDPGQHILQAPKVYVTSKKIDSDYVQLGTFHRITIPVGYVAIAKDKGKKIIITPTPIEVDDEHKKYVIDTDGEIFQTQSPTFHFDEKTGFKSTQLEDIKLDTLTVNTKELIPFNVVGSVRYKIVDPVLAFLITDDVVGDIRKQAQATLTSVFAKLSIDEIASSVATTNISHKKGKEKEKEIPHDMLHEATDMFMDEFKLIARQWGVETKLINITNLELLDEKYKETLKTRAKQRMEAATQRMIVETQTESELKKADREKQIKLIQAEANAQVTKTTADAKLYAAEQEKKAAEQLSSQPLAAQLAVLDKQAEIAKNLGDKTVITDMQLGQIVNYQKNHALLFNKDVSKAKQAAQQEDNVTSLFAQPGKP